jgi:hypothetical protein
LRKEESEMNKMKGIAVVLSFAAVVCFVFSLSQAGKGGEPGPSEPSEPPGQGGFPPGQGGFPPGLSFKVDYVETDPIWQMTQQGTNISVYWADHELNPRFAIYDTEGNNHLASEDEYPGESHCDDVVLDKETGLVWKRCGSCGSNYNAFRPAMTCHRYPAGKKYGWRLAAIEELQSLADGSGLSPDGIAPGHPFYILTDRYYISSTTLGWQQLGWKFGTNELRLLDSYEEDPNHTDPDDYYCCWCVRGGRSHDGHSIEFAWGP